MTIFRELYHDAVLRVSSEGPSQQWTSAYFSRWYASEEGGHWKKYESESQRLADMGITACWLPRKLTISIPCWDAIADLPAPTKGQSPQSTGYDIYDIWDLGEFDQKGSKGTRWGEKEDLLKAIKSASDKGIITYIDAVMNHK